MALTPGIYIPSIMKLKFRLHFSWEFSFKKARVQIWQCGDGCGVPASWPLPWPSGRAAAACLALPAARAISCRGTATTTFINIDTKNSGTSKMTIKKEFLYHWAQHTIWIAILAKFKGCGKSWNENGSFHFRGNASFVYCRQFGSKFAKFFSLYFHFREKFRKTGKNRGNQYIHE